MEPTFRIMRHAERCRRRLPRSHICASHARQHGRLRVCLHVYAILITMLNLRDHHTSKEACFGLFFPQWVSISQNGGVSTKGRHDQNLIDEQKVSGEQVLNVCGRQILNHIYVSRTFCYFSIFSSLWTIWVALKRNHTSSPYRALTPRLRCFPLVRILGS